MSFELWIAFVLTASVILLIPGPTIIYVVVQSLVNGRKVTPALVAGVLTGDAVCISLSIIGLSTLLALSSALFTTFKFIGAAYLVWLGVEMMRKGNVMFELGDNQHQTGPAELYKKVTAITALNPKGIIFFSAFMPQFVNPETSVSPQLAILTVTFLILALVNALFYSLLAGRVSHYFKNEKYKKWIGISGGMALIGAGAVTASTR